MSGAEGGMTSRERILRMLDHREADRVPIFDSPWEGTLARWRREGMPADADPAAYFGFDRFQLLFADNSPRFERKVLEETERYRIYTTSWGQTLKSFRDLDSTPEFIRCEIDGPDSWRRAKARIRPDRDRIDWTWYAAHYKRLRESGAFLAADLFFGFDWMHSWVSSTETILAALIEEPEWCREMFDHFLDTHLALFDQVWDAGYTFDAIRWPEDLGYKGHLFFSPDLYRSLLRPVHEKAVRWAREKGIRAMIHSCGYVEPLVPDFIDIGIDCLNPVEVKAGMDPVAIKRRYGDRIALHGGIDASLFDDPEALMAQIRQVVPILKENGGYLFSSDHSIPPSISLPDYQAVLRTTREAGRYD